MSRIYILTIGLLSVILMGCRGDLPFIYSEEETITEVETSGNVYGFYLLNEGNMGSNKASLDYFDYATGNYHRNIYAERNPEIVKELGDVGNDLKIYGSKLYAVINCSHYVEVMDVHTAKHVGSFEVLNGRYITFHGGKAYVSSYAGPVQLDPNARPGKVMEVDTTNFQTTREVVVGYQPEEMVIANGKLYVANSGGYRFPNYDTTVSVVDLSTFEVIKSIDVAINLHRMEVDRFGRIYVSSRGDYYGIGSDVYTIDTQTDEVIGKLGIAASEMCLCGDSIYMTSVEWSYVTESNTINYTLYDVESQQIVSKNFITDGTDKEIKIPYGIAVNPETKEIFVADATNYVTPGYLYCFTPEGKKKWKVTTGDIPAHFAFTSQMVASDEVEIPPVPENASAYITQVLEYMPAPGQFINEMPAYEEGDTQETMNQKVLETIGYNNRGLISLGGFGGYVTVGFDHTIANKAGLRDFRVLGNSFYAQSNPDPTAPEGGSSEPGVIMVAYDANKNGVPDENEWYEIAGSSHEDPTTELWYNKAVACGNDVHTYKNYEMTYYRPTSELTTSEDRNQYIRWEDNRGNSGYKVKNNFHNQPYFPQWCNEDKLTFRGTRLPQNGIDESGAGNYFVCYKFIYGYADNEKNDKDESAIDIDWAVDSQGRKVHLPGVDFIRIYTGVNQENGWLGECSTEVAGIEDLHVLGEVLLTPSDIAF